jgi:hypothetical protein
MPRFPVSLFALALGVLFVARLPAFTRVAPGSHVEGVPSSGMVAVVVSATGETLRSAYEGLPANPSRVALMDRFQPGITTARILKPTPPAGGCAYCGFIPEEYSCVCEETPGHPTLCRFDGSWELCGAQEIPMACGCAFDYPCGSCGGGGA